MKISNVVLDKHEIEILRTLSQTNCTGICCDNCPLRITLCTGMRVCMVDAAVTCLKTNNLNPYERIEKEKS